MARKPRIAHLAGPHATIQNTPPLVTSNKARAARGLAPLANPDGSPTRFDPLRAQRLAAPAKVYVEQFSGHPLESERASLYAPPDGYVGADGTFSKMRRAPEDKPVYEVELRPEDGLYPLPYMGLKADGAPWEEECAEPFAGEELTRQTFFPDGSRQFEEIDRLGLDAHGHSNLISSRADIDFYRVLPASGYVNGQPEARRTDEGEGDIPPEQRGRDFFAYRPYHLLRFPTRASLARMTNAVRRVLASGMYDGAFWTEGSPSIEETAYWLNLILDTTLPLCGCAAQRAHGMISTDGTKNIVDSVQYLVSRVWADDQGRNEPGVVVIQEQQIFTPREVQKADARPGGYVATGGHGGIIGAVGFDGPPRLHFIPKARHTYLSEVNVTRMPETVQGVRKRATGIERIPVRLKEADGALVSAAIPKVAIVKDGSFMSEEPDTDPEDHPDLIALIQDALKRGPLSGLVVEAFTPYGLMTSNARHLLTLRAIYSGLPVARVGRGDTQGFAPLRPPFISATNLTSTKARILLMACLMRFGALPPAADPDRPTAVERRATLDAVAQYQAVFEKH
jgi:hypothetical protein